MSNTLEDITDLDGVDNVKRVGRLSDMDTREVSIVDRAANQRRFLMVKRDQEETVDATATKTDETTTKVETKAPEVAKSMASAILQQASERLDYLATAIGVAEVAKDESEIPAAYGREARSIQFMLKSLAGVTCKNTVPLIFTEVSLDEAPAITKSYRDESLKVIEEVTRRIAAIKTDVTGVDILDAGQARRINATADVLARIPHQKAESVILLSSLDDDQRALVLDAVQKAAGDLVDVYVALQTDSVQKNAHVADQFEVGSILHGHAAALEKAIAEALTGRQGEVDLIDAAVEEMRALQSVTKAYKVKPMNGKFTVVDDEGKTHGSFPNPGMAAGVAARMNAKKADAKTAKMEALMKVMNLEVEKSQESQEDEVEKTTTEETQEVAAEKVGAPMQGDRLNRLKSAVSLLKSALIDLRSGSVSMEKFQKVGAVLSSLISELQVEKRGAAAITGGVADVRTTSPEAPNVGSGVQPDTSTIGTMDDVMGEGTGGTASLLKNVEGMIDAKVAEVSKAKDTEIKALQAQLTQLRKSRSAPSAPPSDGEIDGVQKSNEGDQTDASACYWPSDLASWDGSENRD